MNPPIGKIIVDTWLVLNTIIGKQTQLIEEVEPLIINVDGSDSNSGKWENPNYKLDFVLQT